MIKHLFLFDLRSNKVLIISFSSILLIYSTISTGMFDPVSAEAMNAMLELIPVAMMRMLGFENFGTELTVYLARYLYGFIFLMFPIISIIMIGNKLIAKHVDSGSMAYLLTTPHTRVQIALTQAVFSFIATFIIVVSNVIVIIIMSSILFPGDLMIGKFIILNLVLLSALSIVSSIVFLFGCYFDEASKSVGFGASFGIGFFIINAVKNINPDLEWLKYLTVFSIVNIDRIFEGGLYSFLSISISTLASIIIYGIGIYIFNKKSLII